VALLFMAAARILEVGGEHLTLTGGEGVAVARVLPGAIIVPAHCEGWAHYSETPLDIERIFTAAGLGDRLRWLEPGRRTSFNT